MQTSNLSISVHESSLEVVLRSKEALNFNISPYTSRNRYALH